jgi:putative ABC transport system permease protein
MLRFILEIVRRVHYFTRKHRMEADLREEMDAHLSMLADETDLVSAKQRLGNVTRWQEISREVWGCNWLESLARDAGYGARLLLRSPGFTATACLSLAIGLGATMGIFSLMNALLYKTLPVAEPEQLWELGHTGAEEKDDNFSYRMLDALQKANRSGIPLFALGGDYVQMNYGTASRNVPALIVSGDAFRILKLKARIGRLLTAEDDIRGLPRGANCVLSYRLWQSEFHGDPNVLGKRLSIGVQPFTIVGVAPPGFFGFYVGAYSDLILPIAGYAATNPAQPILDNGGWTWLNIMARVPASVPVREFIANLNTAYPSIRQHIEPPATEGVRPERLYAQSAATGISAIRERFSKPLFVLLTMTVLILLIACANLANLLLARSVVRYREMAIRLSMGAHRGRILRQLLTESALLGALGAGAGIPVYFACTVGLLAFLRSGFDPNVFLDTRPDWRFLAGVVALLFSTVLLFGFVPAWRAIHSDLNTALSESSQRLAARTSFGKVVVAIQISLSLVLLLGATLLSRSLFDLRTFNPGFRRDHLLIAHIDTSQTIHKNADVAQFFDALVDEVRALPGVRSAAASVVVPLSGRTWQQDYEVLGRTERGPHAYHSFENWVTPEYFETLGTPLILGRNLKRADSPKAVQVALVNRTFAARAFGPSNAIGRQVYEKGKKGVITIVGVVSDTPYRTLRDDAPPTLYRPIAQLPPSFPFVLTLNLEVWTNSPATDLRKPVEELVSRRDSHATADFRTFDSLIDSNLLYERLLTTLSIAFGLIGLFLSGTGVYGLSSYSVARRTSEFGIRMALGASPRGILRLMLSEQIRLLAIALAAGLLMSTALTRFLRAWLFGVSATDPILYSLALLIIGALALLAAFVPARRAARLNPLTALRCE